MSPFDWKKQPAALSQGLQKDANARAGSAKGIDTRRREGKDTGTLHGISRRADELLASKSHGGAYSRAARSAR